MLPSENAPGLFAYSVSGALDSCRGGRTVPWSNIVLGTIIFIVASVMSISLLVFFASSENDQRKMVRDHHYCIAKQQVNKKFHKFERVYRDCIKRTRDKTRIHCIPHDAPGT